MQDQPEIRGMTCSANAYGVTAEFRLHNKAVKGWEFSKVCPGAESQKSENRTKLCLGGLCYMAMCPIVYIVILFL